jgi:lysophospholipase L1-like esterase
MPLLLLVLLPILPVLLVGLLALQCLVTFRGIARSNVGRARGIISQNGEFGLTPGTDGDKPLSLAFLGNSLAAGLEADSAADTPGFLVGEALAARTGRTVILTNVAIAGSRSADLERQLTRLLERTTPDLVAISTGANDAPFAHGHRRAAEHLAPAIRALRLGGTAVVRCTVPRLATPPRCRAHFARCSNTRAGPRVGARRRWRPPRGRGASCCTRRAGPALAERPDELLSHDRFHPSPDGYRMACEAIVEAALAELRRSGGRSVPSAA